jgi:hypothetical protein
MIILYVEYYHRYYTTIRAGGIVIGNFTILAAGPVVVATSLYVCTTFDEP